MVEVCVFLIPARMEVRGHAGATSAGKPLSSYDRSRASAGCSDGIGAWKVDRYW